MERISYLATVAVFLITNVRLNLSQENWSCNKDPEISPGLFQGDIRIDDTAMMRHGLLHASYRWPNNTIRYHISESFSDYKKQSIRAVVQKFENVTCLIFEELTTLVSPCISVNQLEPGCSSNIGYLGIIQSVNLADECFTKTLGTVTHEFMHALGFYHQQSSHDRDLYVEIIYENVEPGLDDNFQKFGPETISDFNISYDYGSIMHYSPCSFGISNMMTVRPLDDEVLIMGQRNGLSSKDIAKINAMYNC